MTVATLILAAIFLGGGIISAVAALTGARWFFSAAGASAFTGRRHRAAARVLYGIGGILMVAAAIHLLGLVC